MHVRVGGGTTFAVYLPAIASAVVPKPVADETAVYRGTERLLVVEDEPLLRTGLVAFLQRCGYSTVEAPSAVAALDVWRSEQGSIDLVITDIVRPRHAGSELAAHARDVTRCDQSRALADEAPNDPSTDRGLQRPREALRDA